MTMTSSVTCKGYLQMLEKIIIISNKSCLRDGILLSIRTIRPKAGKKGWLSLAMESES